jgi:threonine/homoserine/homoserine lactone efflux protein
MGSLLLDVLPYALVAIIPACYVAALTALILTNSKRPILGALAFTAGPLVLDAIVAAVVLAIFWGSGAPAGSSTVSGWIDIALGVVLLALGVQAVFEPSSPEKDAATRARIQKAAGGSVLALLVTGVVTQIIDMDALGIFGVGLKEIVSDAVPVWQAVVAVAFMLAIMLVPYYAPAVYFAVRRQRASEGLGRVSDWLITHLRALEIAAGLVIGVPFLLKGLAIV